MDDELRQAVRDEVKAALAEAFGPRPMTPGGRARRPDGKVVITHTLWDAIVDGAMHAVGDLDSEYVLGAIRAGAEDAVGALFGDLVLRAIENGAQNAVKDMGTEHILDAIEAGSLRANVIQKNPKAYL